MLEGRRLPLLGGILGGYGAVWQQRPPASNWNNARQQVLSKTAVGERNGHEAKECKNVCSSGTNRKTRPGAARRMSQWSYGQGNAEPRLALAGAL